MAADTRNYSWTSYRQPRCRCAAVVGQGPREDRNLNLSDGRCLILFVAQTPRLAREAHVTATELDMLLGATLMGMAVHRAVLMFYMLAGGIRKSILKG